MALLVLGGCGPSAGAGPQGGGGTESGGGSTTDDVCGALESLSDPGPPVTITIVNQRATPAFIRLGGCFGTLPLVFTDADGIVRPWQLAGDCFPEECGEFIAQGECSVACADCDGVAPLRLDPGATHTVIWSGGLYSEHELPPECVGGESCPTCLRLDQASGRFDLALSFYATCSGECTCEASGMGSACPTIDYHPELGGELSTSVLIDYPAQTLVTLAMQ